jgi:predicted DNA-binding antitoxin AbrB/MazE fold protein
VARVSRRYRKRKVIYDKIAGVVKNMSNVIEAVFDGKVFRPESDVELKPNTRVEITVTVKNNQENSKEFRVRSKHLGFRKDLNYDKTGELLEEIEDAG